MNKTKEIKTPCRKISLKEQENYSPVNVKEYKSLLGHYYILQLNQDLI